MKYDLYQFTDPREQIHVQPTFVVTKRQEDQNDRGY